jgi:hypothetical protein
MVIMTDGIPGISTGTFSPGPTITVIGFVCVNCT